MSRKKLIFVFIEKDSIKMEASQSMFLWNDRRAPWRVSALDRILMNKGMADDILTFYRGCFNHGVVGHCSESGRDEIYDSSKMVRRPSKLGETIVVVTDDVEKPVVFKGYQHGTFYKFQTNSGRHFIITQQELNTLTPKEKRSLRIF